MNECLFSLHIFLVVGCVLVALRQGKEALITFNALAAVLANIFVLKQIDLFGLTVTCSDVFVIGSILGLNLLQENFGKEEAKRSVKISFYALVVFVLCALLHLVYVPSSQDQTQEAFFTIFSSTTRLVVASFGVYYLVQRWDIYFFQWLKKRFDDQKLTIRLWISLVISQAIDTVAFSFLGLYGMVDSVVDIMVMSFAIKCCVIALASPLASLSRRFVRERI